jgi:hypothetical protein
LTIATTSSVYDVSGNWAVLSVLFQTPSRAHYPIAPDRPCAPTPRTAVLNGTLEDAFRRRYSGFRPTNNEGTALAAA